MIRYAFILGIQFAVLGARDNSGYSSVAGVLGEDNFRYQVSLRRGNNHFCGGSIIAAKTILTAAHCLVRRKAADINVVVGTYKLSTGGTAYKAKRIIPHENFTHLPGAHNDIGIIKLYVPITFSENVTRISIARTYIGVGENAVVTGWGKISYWVKGLPNILLKLYVKTISIERCAVLTRKPIKGGQLCTLPQVGQGACKGDSGGPLVTQGVQIGVVSWSIRCADGYPDVYTRISYYLDWILENSKNIDGEY